jgi:GNAT superfamily N-acetyltransferase
MDGDEPIAAVLQTDWGNEWQCDPISLPSHGLDLRREVWEQALGTAESVSGLAIPVRTDDIWALDFLAQRDLVADDRRSTTMWMVAQDCPTPTSLPSSYCLFDRTQALDRPHHLIRRNDVNVELRLRQTPLYQPELDLFILSDDGEVAGYGMFWNDLVTGVGLVEPMRTEEGHERRGLAGHLLRSGLARLVERGARRLKIGYENPATGSVYQRAGFVADSTVTVFRRT